MSEYEQGAVKYDPQSGSVAVRTNQPEQSGNPILPSQAWLVATPTSGAHFVATAVVEGWVNLDLPDDG